MGLLGSDGGGGGGGAAVGGLAAINPYAALIAAAAKVATKHNSKKWKIIDRELFGDPEHEGNIDRINLMNADMTARRWGAPTNYSGVMTPSGPSPVGKENNLEGLGALMAGLGALKAGQKPAPDALGEVDKAIKSLPGEELPDLGSKRANDLQLLDDLPSSGASRSGSAFKLTPPALIGSPPSSGASKDTVGLDFLDEYIDPYRRK